MRNFIYLVVVIVLALGAYVLINREPVPESERTSVIEQKLPSEFEQRSQKKSPDSVKPQGQPKKTTPIEQDLFLWRGQMKAFFMRELPQDKTALMDYTEMKDGFEEDRLDAYDRFMDEASNTGEEFNITDLDEGEYKTIQEEYFKAFEKRFGRDVFVKYLKTMQEYNDKVVKGEDESLKVNF